MSVNTVPLYKTSDRQSIRPIGIEDCLAKAYNREVVLEHKVDFIRVLQPEQLAMSPGGGTKIVTSVRMLLELRRDFICVQLDMENAFNSTRRAAVIRAMEAVSYTHLTLPTKRIV